MCVLHVFDRGRPTNGGRTGDDEMKTPENVTFFNDEPNEKITGDGPGTMRWKQLRTSPFPMTNLMKKLFLQKILQLHFCFLSEFFCNYIFVLYLNFFAIVLGFLFFIFWFFIIVLGSKIYVILKLFGFFLFLLFSVLIVKKCFYKNSLQNYIFVFYLLIFLHRKLYIYIYMSYWNYLILKMV